MTSYIDEYLKAAKEELSEALFSNINYFFNYVKTKELAFDKSIVDFTIEEVADVLISENAINYKTVKKKASFLSDYLEYLFKKEIITLVQLNNHPVNTLPLYNSAYFIRFLRTINVLDKYDDKFFLSADDFTDWLDLAFENKLLETPVSRFANYKMVLILMWIGFNEINIPQIKLSDVNLFNKTISGIKISNEYMNSYLTEYILNIRPSLLKNNASDKLIVGAKSVEMGSKICSRISKDVNSFIKNENINRRPISILKIKNSKLFEDAYTLETKWRYSESAIRVYLTENCYKSELNKIQQKGNKITDATKSDLFASYSLWRNFKIGLD